MLDLSGFRCVEVDLGSPEYVAMLGLREAVLRRPLGLSFTAEEVAREVGCIHLAGFLGEEVVATLLLQPHDAATVQMRQVAVSPGLQGSGIGARLLLAAEDAARRRGFRRMVAHARMTALAFYERHGYTPEGEIFVETTIPHRMVTKALA
jgi:GNAT superfamily N-acetyltransferase